MWDSMVFDMVAWGGVIAALLVLISRWSRLSLIALAVSFFTICLLLILLGSWFFASFLFLGLLGSYGPHLRQWWHQSIFPAEKPIITVRHVAGFLLVILLGAFVSFEMIVHQATPKSPFYPGWLFFIIGLAGLLIRQDRWVQGASLTLMMLGGTLLWTAMTATFQNVVSWYAALIITGFVVLPYALPIGIQFLESRWQLKEDVF